MLVFIAQIIFIGSIIGMLIIVLRKISVLRNSPVISKEIIEMEKKPFPMFDFDRVKRKMRHFNYLLRIFFKKKFSFGFWRNLFKKRREKKTGEPDLSPNYWQKIKEE